MRYVTVVFLKMKKDSAAVGADIIESRVYTKASTPDVILSGGLLLELYVILGRVSTICLSRLY